MQRERNELGESVTWDLAPMFTDEGEWENTFKEMVGGREEMPLWPQLQKQNFDFTKAKDIRSCLDLLFSVERTLSKLHTYAHLKHDQNIADEENKGRYERISTIYHIFSSEIAWVRPEILTISKEVLHSGELALYSRYIEKILNLKPYTLSAPMEGLMSMSGEPLSTSYQAFSALNNVDIEFKNAVNASGQEKPLSHGTYSLYLQDGDRVLRQTAFTNVHSAFGSLSHTITELLCGAVKSHLFNARARGFKSCLEAALTPHAISKEVYTTLIETVNEEKGKLHDYVALRKEILGYETLHSYDMHVPLFQSTTKKYSYEEAVDLVLESMAPLGEEYVATLEKGLKNERWVDVYETRGKRSGAYSSGCYDSRPYMLLNFQGTLRDVMTLAHEAGHSMHTYYSNSHQKYHDSHYPIFVAEVASTFNEELVFSQLLQRAESDEERRYLLNMRIDDIRSTMFRQVQFAEFELKIHEMAEKRIPLTADGLKNVYGDLNRKYYGDSLTLTPESGFEYLRIPHFYYNFYVYQYATGISAAHALVEMVQNGGLAERKRYLEFLSSGGSKYPLDLLERAGVDMTKSDAAKKLLAHFGALTSELRNVVTVGMESWQKK